MKQYKLQDIRNIGFVGHGGSGKTSLAESVLYLTGVSERLGKTGDTVSYTHLTQPTNREV